MFNQVEQNMKKPNLIKSPHPAAICWVIERILNNIVSEALKLSKSRCGKIQILWSSNFIDKYSVTVFNDLQNLRFPLNEFF